MIDEALTHTDAKWWIDQYGYDRSPSIDTALMGALVAMADQMRADGATNEEIEEALR